MKFVKQITLGCVIACSMLLSACKVESYCLREQPYDKAQSVKPIVVTEGLSIPQSPTALNVPPSPPNEVPFGTALPGGRTDANGGRRVQCLDQPPPLPATAKIPTSS